MKKLIGLTFAILLGSSSMALAVLTDVTQATALSEVNVVAEAPVNAGKPCNCQATGYKDPENGLLEVAENNRKSAYEGLLTDSTGKALAPQNPGTGAE